MDGFFDQSILDDNFGSPDQILRDPHPFTFACFGSLDAGMIPTATELRLGRSDLTDEPAFLTDPEPPTPPMSEFQWDHWGAMPDSVQLEKEISGITSLLDHDSAVDIEAFLDSVSDVTGSLQDPSSAALLDRAAILGSNMFLNQEFESSAFQEDIESASEIPKRNYQGDPPASASPMGTMEVILPGGIAKFIDEDHSSRRTLTIPVENQPRPSSEDDREAMMKRQLYYGCTEAKVDSKKVRQDIQIIPSRFCHICARTAKTARQIVCSNIRLGTCRKVICEKCFEKFEWNWELAASGSDWTCTHCVGVCPDRAQCSTYCKVNEKLRKRREGIRKVRSVGSPGTSFAIKPPSRLLPRPDQ